MNDKMTRPSSPAWPDTVPLMALPAAGLQMRGGGA